MFVSSETRNHVEPDGATRHPPQRVCGGPSLSMKATITPETASGPCTWLRHLPAAGQRAAGVPGDVGRVARKAATVDGRAGLG